MATANIRAVITADDKASAVVKQFGTNVEKSSGKIVGANKNTGLSFTQLAIATAGAGVAAKGLLGIISSSVAAANKEQAALIGLSSVTKAFGVDTEKAKQAAQDLVSDGLMTIGDAATGLKNLLASGFSLDQAIVLMNRFKDSAAFGRQSALGFGDAIVSATEGIKNGNSILVDNAGVTKNLSVILEEAGFSAQDLMRSTTDASVRQSLFNGIVKETNAQVGDAAKLTETYAGKQAALGAETQTLKARLGEALQPALQRVLDVVKPLVEKFAQFAERHPNVVAAFMLITTAVVGLTAVLGSLGLALIGLRPIFAATAVAGKVAFTGITTTVGGTVAATKGLAAYLRSPAALGAWGAFAAVAIGSFIKIKNEVAELNRVLDHTNQTIRNRDINKFMDTYNMIKEKQGIEAAHRFRDMQSRAIGGPVNAGQPYLVGEEGPELVVPKASGTVLTAPETATAIQGGGTTINLNVNVGMYAGTEMEKRRMAETLLQALRDVAQSRNMTLEGLMR